MNIKKGDNVILLAGKNKGQKGTVLSVLRESNKVLVEGINKVKKHIKARSKDQKGSIIEKESPVHISNVALLDPKSGTATRVTRKKVGEKYVRVAVKSGAEFK